MDLNLVVLCGRLVTDSELRVLDTGSRLLRLLVAVRSEDPVKRMDVVPVTLWEPGPGLISEPPTKRQRVWVCGSVQRRFWEAPEGRRSRLEVVAEQVHVRDVDHLEPIALPMTTGDLRV